MKKSTLKNTVNVSTLKARLSEYLGFAKSGQEIVVTDRHRPVAKVIPFQAGTEMELEISPARGDRKLLRKLSAAPRLKTAVSAVDLLLEERRKR